MKRQKAKGKSNVEKLTFAFCLFTFAFVSADLRAQRGRGAAPGPPPTGQGVAPIDVTGYWVSLVVDEWRFRVTPQKGAIAYLPLNAEARQIANAWDPAKDEADGKSCKAYGAVGVMQRPGRLHVTWDNPNTGTSDYLNACAPIAHARLGATEWHGLGP